MQQSHKNKFWQRVNKQSSVFGVDGTYPTECWEWTGGIMSKGYGVVQIESTQYRVHRLAWILHTGQSITPQDYICHHCDNRKCVRPDHLFRGDAQSNMTDRNNKQRQARGEQQGLSKLSSSDVKTIRDLYATGDYSHRQLAQLFKCARNNIASILSGTTWSHTDNRTTV